MKEEEEEEALDRSIDPSVPHIVPFPALTPQRRNGNVFFNGSLTG